MSISDSSPSGAACLVFLESAYLPLLSTGAPVAFPCVLIICTSKSNRVRVKENTLTFKLGGRVHKNQYYLDNLTWAHQKVLRPLPYGLEHHKPMCYMTPLLQSSSKFGRDIYHHRFLFLPWD